MKIRATLEAIHSRRDTYGNCYWALMYTDHETGHTVEGTISGGQSNINAIRRYQPDCDGWDSSIQTSTTELGIREFNRLTKEWEYIGCTSDELADHIRTQLEALSGSA